MSQMSERQVTDVLDLSDVRYLAQFVPESFPDQPQPCLGNWSDEEKEMHCGIYTDARVWQLMAVANTCCPETGGCPYCTPDFLAA